MQNGYGFVHIALSRHVIEVLYMNVIIMFRQLDGAIVCFNLLDLLHLCAKKISNKYNH